jgi:hypothetical protein
MCQTDKPQFAEPTPGADLPPVRRLLCGGLAGITSVTFTYPLDIVRTRLSIQSAGFAALGKHEGKLPGMWQTMIKMYKTEGGVLGLYRGIIPTVAGVAPYVSFGFLCTQAQLNQNRLASTSWCMNLYGHTSLYLGRKTRLGTANWQPVLFLVL